MKLTIIGDPHTKNDNLAKIDHVLDLAISLNNPIIILGDLFDTKEIIRSKSLNFIFQKLKNITLPVYILVGNHDWHNLECKEHSLTTLGGLPNVTIVDHPIELTIGDRHILMMPYYDDIAEFTHEFNFYAKDIAFIHQGVTGFDYGNGFIADGKGHGEIDLVNFNLSQLLVISGHFHKFAKHPNFYFLGAPFSQSYGESNQEKFIGELDLTTNNLKLIPTGLPQHITQTIDCGEPLPELVWDNKNYNRVILKGTKSQILDFDTKLLPKDVKILKHVIQEDVNITTADETLDNATLFKVWAGIKGLAPDTIDLGLTFIK